MAFDTKQDSYIRFRDTLIERTDQIVVWAGAGLSRSAGLPTWIGLRDRLIAVGEQKANNATEEEAKRVKSLLTAANHEPDLWQGFENVRRALRESTYSAAVKSAFHQAVNLKPPSLYKKLWQLGVRGFITLNLDRFAGRSFNDLYGDKLLTEFRGNELADFTDVLKRGTDFVANLHGTFDVESSWVLSASDFSRLSKSEGYKSFIHTCITSRKLLFIGITAEDQAAGGHLQQLRSLGINIGDHFWLTNRSDGPTNKWAEDAGIQQIAYRANDTNHSEINEFFADLSRYAPREQQMLPLMPKNPTGLGGPLPSPAELRNLDTNDVRKLLNGEAVRILESNDEESKTRYQAFRNTYAEAIHRAWFLRDSAPHNILFNYELTEFLAKGAFGEVHKALDSSNTQVAIKILHNDASETSDMLDGFRRGVKAMEILSKNKVQGMVPYLDFWEIPPCNVMEYVDGPNLEEAVLAKHVEDWKLKVYIAMALTRIIRTAHQVPERVLHRDIRPSNIMLRGFYPNAEEWDVVVLDFDLAWYRDAFGHSVSHSNVVYGYLAPEQANKSTHLTRNALVDSFGVGMTLFFLVTKVHPVFAQHQHSDWLKILQNKVAKKQCKEWRSVPKRFARLIDFATKDEQSHRWDMTRIVGELERLNDALSKPSEVRSVELLTEELAARCERIRDVYVWDQETLTANAEMVSGFLISLKADEGQRKVRLVFSWMQTGNRRYEDVKRYLPTRADKSAACLRQNGWVQIDKKIGSGGAFRLEASFNTETLRNGILNTCAQALSNAIAEFEFK